MFVRSPLSASNLSANRLGCSDVIKSLTVMLLDFSAPTIATLGLKCQEVMVFGSIDVVSVRNTQLISVVEQPSR